MSSLLTVGETGVMSYNVFRKPSNSGKYLDFNSYHHTTQKRNVDLTLKNRAHKIYVLKKQSIENMR